MLRVCTVSPHTVPADVSDIQVSAVGGEIGAVGAVAEAAEVHD